MKPDFQKTVFGAELAQIAWVVKDVHTTVKFFEDFFGIRNFQKPSVIKVQDYGATYYGKPTDAETLTAMAYSGSTFIEIIQPLSGKSVFHDYLERNPAGGLQHVAYRIPLVKLDEVITQFSRNGFEVVSRFNTPPAQIVFFDTYKEIGVMTEIMGITPEGEKMIEQMKG